MTLGEKGNIGESRRSAVSGLTSGYGDRTGLLGCVVLFAGGETGDDGQQGHVWEGRC